MSEDDIRSLLTEALASTPNLSDHLDEDTSEYIISILIDDPSDEDAREAVTGFISSSIDDEHGEEVCGNFFEILDGALCGNGVGKSATSSTTASALDDLPRRLDNAITLKSHDIQTFASGLLPNSDQSSNLISEDDENTSDIQSFYANMIDVSNVSAKSERERRKARQKEMREKMEEEERKRAIDDAMRMMEDDNDKNRFRIGKYTFRESLPKSYIYAMLNRKFFSWMQKDSSKLLNLEKIIEEKYQSKDKVPLIIRMLE